MKKLKVNKKRIIIGITGSFGSGKSTVARLFRAGGFKIIDADKIVHRLLKADTGIYKKIIKAFGHSIISKDKDIDRAKLGEVAFKEKRLVKRLNRIIHPAAISIIKKQLSSAVRNPVVLDAPLLIETGLHRLVNILVVVRINRKEQIKRLIKKTSLSSSDILIRIKYQIPLRDKLRLADFIIDNSGSLAETKKQVELIRRKLWKN